jgi:hypothetical protein
VTLATISSPRIYHRELKNRLSVAPTKFDVEAKLLGLQAAGGKKKRCGCNPAPRLWRPTQGRLGENDPSRHGSAEEKRVSENVLT